MTLELRNRAVLSSNVARRPRCSRRILPFLIGLLLVLAGCDAPLPVPNSATYTAVVAAFYTGVAAMEVGDDVRADLEFDKMTRLASGEPAGWTNWGALALRQGKLDLAEQRLKRANTLAPKSEHVFALLGVLESKRGNIAQSISDLRRSMELDPSNLRVAYALAQEIERQASEPGAKEVQVVLRRILQARPDNLPSLLELARVAAKQGDAASAAAALARFSSGSSAWPAEVREQLTAVRSAISSGDLRTAAIRTARLRNVMMRVPEYRKALLLIKAPGGAEIEPLHGFVLMQPPAFNRAPSDAGTRFAFVPAKPFEKGGWDWIGAIELGTDAQWTLAVANGDEVRLANGAALPFPGRGHGWPGPEGLLQVDFSYDFKTDIVLAGAGGVRLFRQEQASDFVDVTASTALPKSITEAAYLGAWAADIEADGDLDIVLGVATGTPAVLRNNGNGTFTVIHPFAGVSGLRQFLWVDLDGDGAPEAVLIDGSDHLHVFANYRQGDFRERAVPSALGIIKSIAVSDANREGILQLLTLQLDGTLMQMSDKNEGESWITAEIARVPDASVALQGEVRLHVADIDNNATVDVYLSQVGTGVAKTIVWLGDEHGRLVLVDPSMAPVKTFQAFDQNGDGRLDLLSVSQDGHAFVGVNRGTKNYHWQIIRPRAARAFGDQRINPFGIGGEVEIRTGPLVQKTLITGPHVHFGLGELTRSDIVRVLWPSGVIQAEFELNADKSVVAEQRLKGSCPYLFAYNGKEMAFVKDTVPWGSAIGLRINNVGSAKVEATEEWYKVSRRELVPHDGYYDLRITGELWEVYYYDELALATVDHPAGTEIFMDERFAIPPPKLQITTTSLPKRLASATDDTGRDVSETIEGLDGTTVDSFGLGQYQGVTRDHYIELDLGTDAPVDKPLVLIAHGSLHPTDSSINVALSQGGKWIPHGLSLEVLDERGRWVLAKDNLGFPAGRKKIVLFDLQNVFRPGTPHRLRLRTNLEIYWDQIQWAEVLPNAALKVARLDPDQADLHYRGFSVVTVAKAGAPEIPHYNQIASTTQTWRDLAGYYTRYGDVRELLRQTDDRYVIMGAGDEISLRFPEQAPPPSGSVRDFLVMGDGWIKDGDYNSTFSKGVQPLPHHGEREYTQVPGRLEDEWTYRQHPRDWENFHTRYVTPDHIRNALRDMTAP